jgi:hypothetical protein
LGCIARETSALIGSGFGKGTITGGSLFADAQADSIVSAKPSEITVVLVFTAREIGADFLCLSNMKTFLLDELSVQSSNY